MPSCNVSCAGLDEFDSRVLIAPNPDISGIGVLIGFLATAYLTLLIVSVYYFCGYVPDHFTNQIDQAIINFARRRLRSKPLKPWKPTLRSAILMFSDQQLVTGIALLVSGYVQLPCGLDTLHWQMLIYLAWFSSLTHLTTLTILRQYFHDNTAARSWRVALMLIMVIMLSVALIPSGDSLWFPSDVGFQSSAIPVLCYYRRLSTRERKTGGLLTDAYQSSTMLISLLVLFISYLTRIVKLSKRAAASTKLWLRTKPGRVLKTAIQTSDTRAAQKNRTTLWSILYLGLETMHVGLRAVLDLFESLFWELIWLVFALGWGTSHLFHARVLMDPDISNLENTWGFGQVLPVILLALPILSIGESYYKHRQSIEESTESSRGRADNISRRGTSPNARRSRFYIGQWPNKTPDIEPNLSTSEVLNLGAIRRTGSDIQNEEANLGLTQSRIGPACTSRARDQATEGPEPQVASLPEAQVATVYNTAQDYYQFEWFWLIVHTIFLFVSEVILWVLAILGNIVDLWLVVTVAVAYMLFFTLFSSTNDQGGIILSRHRGLVEVYSNLG